MKWLDRLEQAKKRREAKHKPFFSNEDVELSQLWITDPISEVSDKIQLRNNDLHFGPIDIYLILDGIFFTVGIEKDDVDLAENCYKGIQKRVQKLLDLKAK